MTHTDLSSALFFFLVFMTLLLVMFIGAVIAGPSAPPASAQPAPDVPAPPVLDAPAPPAPDTPAPPAPLPQRRSLDTAAAASTAGWSDGAEAASHADALPPVYTRVRRPSVSGAPPWGPAPRPPGPDPWTTEGPPPGWRRRPAEGQASLGAARSASSTPPAGMPVPAGNQARYPRHGREP